MNWLGFDVETSGSPHDYALQPWRVAQGTAWVTSIVAHDPVRKVGFDARFDLEDVRPAMDAMLRHAIAVDATIVGWNVTFDVQWLLAYGFDHLVSKVKWLDGMLLWKHAVLEPERAVSASKRFTFGLKECVAALWPSAAGYETDVDFHSVDPGVLASLHAYNHKDVLFTLAAARHWWGKLSPRQRNVALIEADAIYPIARANLEGMRVDTLAAAGLGAHLRDVIRSGLDRLVAVGGDETVLASPAKLQSLLFDEWGLNSAKTTTSGGRSTDAEVLEKLALDDDRVRAVLDVRQSKNRMTKFVEAPINAAAYNGDGKGRPQAKLFGTVTSRLTYSSSQKGTVPGKRPGTTKQGKLPTGWAQHQMPRDERYRGLILAPEGYHLVEFDAAGQEFRWMACEADDSTMLRLCAPGEDAHAFMGAQIAHIEYAALRADVHSEDDEVRKLAKPRRQLGKVGNLSCQYRTSAPTLRVVAATNYGVDLSAREAEMIVQTYRRSYPGVPLYWARQIAFGRRHGYVENLAGRRVWLKGNWIGRGAWDLESSAINWPIQSIGAEQKFLALRDTARIVRSFDAAFAWDLHDGIYFYVPSTNTDKFMREMKGALDHLDYEKAWGYKPKIPMPFDAKVGPSWGLLREVNIE